MVWTIQILSIMAYITLANQRAIIRKLDLNDINIVGKIYKVKIDFFNRFEEKSLLAMQEFIKNPERFIESYYQQAQKPEDSFQFINEEYNPAYHSDKLCSRLNANYENLKVPDEIIEKGNNYVVKFRTWYESNKHLPDEIFEMRCQLAFKLSFRYEKVEIKNSGNVEFENRSLIDVENEIDNLLDEESQFYIQNERTKVILDKFRTLFPNTFENGKFKNNTNFSINEIKSIVGEYHDKFKKPINSLLIEWYKMKFNPDLDFENKLLDQLGFHKCKNCYNENYLSPSESTYNDDLPF